MQLEMTRPAHIITIPYMQSKSVCSLVVALEVYSSNLTRNLSKLSACALNIAILFAVIGESCSVFWEWDPQCNVSFEYNSYMMDFSNQTFFFSALLLGIST